MGNHIRKLKREFDDVRRMKTRELEVNMYNEIQRIFTTQEMRPSKDGEEEGISDEDLLQHFFGKRHYTDQEIKLVKKIRRKFQQENPGLVCSRNSAGEYLRYYPKNIVEQDRYNNTRQSCIIGLTKGLIKNNKANCDRLGIDWVDRTRELINFIASDTRKYITTGDGDFVKRTREHIEKKLAGEQR
jgi:hypothetical protein